MLSCYQKREIISITEAELAPVTPLAAPEEVDSVTGSETRWDSPSLDGNDQMSGSYDSENNC